MYILYFYLDCFLPIRSLIKRMCSLQTNLEELDGCFVLLIIRLHKDE
jgi:hypothetical protein